MVYFLLYVDDMLIVAKSKLDIQKLNNLLGVEFDMKDFGVTWRPIGIEVKTSFYYHKKLYSNDIVQVWYVISKVHRYTHVANARFSSVLSP